jgi:hypothetical protein
VQLLAQDGVASGKYFVAQANISTGQGGLQQPTCHCRFSDAAALSLKACCGESPLPTGQLARPEPCPASRARPGAGSLRCRFTCMH